MDRRLEVLDALKRVGLLLGRTGIITPVSIYEDEKIRVAVYMGKNCVGAELIATGHMVFYADSEKRIETYRPGEWENYVLDVLIPRVEAIEEKKGEGKFAFEPIDDKELFNG